VSRPEKESTIVYRLEEKKTVKTWMGRVKVKVKQSRYRPGVAQRVPGS